MQGLLFDSPFSAPGTLALWLTVAALVSVTIMLLLTIEFRIGRHLHAHRLEHSRSRWQQLIARACMDGPYADSVQLPRIRRRERIDVMTLWVRTRTLVKGEAAERLKIFARRIALHVIARREAESPMLTRRLHGMRCLGLVGDEKSREYLLQELESDNPAVSVTAAGALVYLDPDGAIRVLIPMIRERRDWPRTQVFHFLRIAGRARIDKPLIDLIRTSDNEAATYLLQYASLMDYPARDRLAADLLTERNDPGVLRAALKIVSGHGGVPRIAALSIHRDWRVRLHAARVLGRIGQPEHLALLERMLSDPEWWVRYRAAQAVVELPFIKTPELRRMQATNPDAFARDILDQAMAEAGRQ